MLKSNVKLRYKEPVILEKIKQHKLYLIFILIFILGLLFGSLLLAYQTSENNTITDGMQNNFNSHFYKIINEQNNISLAEFIITRSIFFLVVFMLGLCIAGHVLIFPAPFIYGFNIGLVYAYTICKYTKGLVFTLIVFTPQILVYSLVIILLSYHAANFSARIYTKVFKKNNTLIAKPAVKHYLMQCALLFIIYNLAALWEYYMTPVIIKTFIK